MVSFIHYIPPFFFKNSLSFEGALETSKVSDSDKLPAWCNFSIAFFLSPI